MPLRSSSRHTPPSYSQGSVRPARLPGLIGGFIPALGPRGLLVEDVSVFGNQGTLTNMPIGAAWTSADNARLPGGYALNFSTTDNHVAIAGGAGSIWDLSGTAVSIVTWAAPTTGQGVNGGRILSKSQNAGSDDYALQAIPEPSNNYRGRIRTAGGLTSIDAPDDAFPFDGTWHQQALIYDGANMTLYIDTEDVATAAKTGILTNGGSTVLYLGDANGHILREFEGKLGVALIFDYAISLSLLTQLFCDPLFFLRPPSRPLRAVAVTVAVSGTTTTGIDEDDMTGAPAETTILTLTGDTWVAAGATFDAQRAAIRDGVTSAQSELLGWNNEVRNTALVGAVVRTSPTVVTITWATAQTASYDITATETIEVTVPAAALVLSLIEVVGTPTFTVDAVAVGGRIMSSLVGAGGLAGMGGIAGQGGGLAA